MFCLSILTYSLVNRNSVFFFFVKEESQIRFSFWTFSYFVVDLSQQYYISVFNMMSDWPVLFFFGWYVIISRGETNRVKKWCKNRNKNVVRFDSRSSMLLYYVDVIIIFIYLFIFNPKNVKKKKFQLIILI